MAENKVTRPVVEAFPLPQQVLGDLLLYNVKITFKFHLLR